MRCVRGEFFGKVSSFCVDEDDIFRHPTGAYLPNDFVLQKKTKNAAVE